MANSCKVCTSKKKKKKSSASVDELKKHISTAGTRTGCYVSSCRLAIISMKEMK